MSNYFRTLLRFEKARAATRDPDEGEDRPPRSRDRDRYDRDESGRVERERRTDRDRGDRYREDRDRDDRDDRYRDDPRDREPPRRHGRRREERPDTPERRGSGSRDRPSTHTGPPRRSRLWEDSDEDLHFEEPEESWERDRERPPRRSASRRKRAFVHDDLDSRRRPSAPPRDDWDDFRPALRTSRRRNRGWLTKIQGWLPWPRRSRANSTESLLAYGQLLDSLRATDTHYSAPGVVLASAGGHASVRQVVDGLVQQARAIGVRIALAEMKLDGEERILRSRDDADDVLPTATNLELTGSGTDQILRDWFERATAGHDLLIVEGPPLTQSVDAALLARSGDGLAIILEPQHTSRAEFDTAIERTRASGCFVLGLVMSRHQHWLPRFLRGFFNTYPRSIRTRARSA